MDRFKHNFLVTLWLTCWTMMLIVSAAYALQDKNPFPWWSGVFILPFMFAGAVCYGKATWIRERNGWPKKSPF